MRATEVEPKESMSLAATVNYAELIQSDRIHGSLYTDPQVFRDELERIWYREWVYIGHESEIPEPGSYVRKQLGRQPVILTRDKDGGVHVLFNRCSHVANLVCHEEKGSTLAFRCPFHGWTYGLDGEVLGIPWVDGYGPDFDKAARRLGAPARVDRYRGFVFASVAETGPDLMEHLGNAAREIDRVCDLSPEGEVELTAGWMKVKTRANWKIGYEAAVDGYHPTFVHRALLSLTNDTIFHATDASAARTRSLGNGHGDVQFFDEYRARGQELSWVGGSREKLPNYVAALEARHGPEKAREIMLDGPPHAVISPNFFIAEQFIMVLEPINAACHVQHETPILWKGAPELNQRNLRQTRASIGPAGLVLADDNAMMERNQRGLDALQPEWMTRGRGSHRAVDEGDGIRVGRLTDDEGVMGFWEWYRDRMTLGA